MSAGSIFRDRSYIVDPQDWSGAKHRVGSTETSVWNGGDAISPGTRPSIVRATRPPRSLTPADVQHLKDFAITKSKDEVKALIAQARQARRNAADVAREADRIRWRVFREELATYRQSKDRRRRAKLLLPPTNYTKTITKFNFSAWYGQYVPAPPRVFSGVYDPWGGELKAVDPSKEYKVIEKLRAKAYGSGFNPAVFTAEGRQAFRMIGNAARRLAQAGSAMKDWDWKGVAENLLLPPESVNFVMSRKGKTAADNWLELQYGWLPLLSDMEAGAQFLGEALNELHPGRQKLQARKTWFEEEGIANTTGGPAFSKRVTIFQLQYIIYGLQMSPVNVPSMYTVATVAWEKLPYSFLVDWVLPIGSYLEACRTASDLKGTVVRTLKRYALTTQVDYGTSMVYLGVFSAPSGEDQVSKMKIERTVTEEIRPPSPMGGMADDLTFLSWRRAANAVALVTQVFEPSKLWSAVKHRHTHTK